MKKSSEFPLTTKSETEERILSSLVSELIPEPYQALGRSLVANRRASIPLFLKRAVPQKTLALSLTGKKCSLNCAHCGGHYLSGMIPMNQMTPDMLEQYDSVLISGGSSPDGSVPIAQHLPFIQSLPPHVKINLHVGLQDASALLSLKGKNLVVSFDLVGDDETIRDVFGLHYSAQQYQKAYLSLLEHFPVIPHVTIGLRGGKLSGENRVLDFLLSHPPGMLTLLVFRPTPGTVFAKASPPSIEETVAFIHRAAEAFPTAWLNLGCMRPAGVYRKTLDPLAWLAGAFTMVMPDPALVAWLAKTGVPIEEMSECCALHRP